MRGVATGGLVEGRRSRGPIWSAVLRYPSVIVGIGLVGLATLGLVWSRTRPGYDPYGWLVWGDQTLHLSLNLGGAPSWKPLPYLFTVPYALAGRFALRLWMVTAVTVSLAGCIFAGRIASRVTRERIADTADTIDPAGRYAPLVAAIFAGAAVLGLQDYAHYILSAQSDSMIVTFCLAAIDMHLCGRYRWALVFAVLGALGRPEVWPFLGLYSIWAWTRVPSMRWMVSGAILVVAVLWFGIPWVTNGRPDVAGQLAMKSPQELHQGQVTGTIRRFIALQFLPVWVAAAGAVLIAVTRRDHLVLALAGGVVLWVIVEIAFALHGFPALPRYMFEAGGVVAVLAGIAVGWLLSDLPRLASGFPRWSGVAVVLLALATLVPGAIDRLRAERVDLRRERARAHQINGLQTTIARVGGYGHVRRCGEPVTEVEYASVLAWLTHLNVGDVGYRPGREKRRRYPIVLFEPVVDAGGWVVRPWHTHRTDRSACANLHVTFRLTKRHPAGGLIHS
ncbi:MAG: hypothetical protein WAL63_04210 [Solirubrobacteraceae bacterium]